MVDALSWAMTAAAVLLVLYALRVVTQDRDPDKPGKKAGLGCGFFFLACLLWSLASHRWVGGWWNAFALGMGIFFATPAIGALTKPHGARLFLGVVGLVLGILLAGPVVKELVVDYQENQENAPRLELETRADDLRRTEGILVEAITGWEASRSTLTATVAGYEGDYEALAGDAAANAALDELTRVERLLAIANDRLTAVRAAIDQAEDALAADVGSDVDAELLKALGLEDLGAPSAEDLTLLEEYDREKRRKALFDGIAE